MPVVPIPDPVPDGRADAALMMSTGGERGDHGVDVAERWHALDHALVGALPTAALYGRALRRWRPDIARRRPRRRPA